MSQFTQADKEAFLSGLHVCMLAIPQPGKGPLLAPIWYDYEPGGPATFIMGPDSRKARLLSEGTRVSLCAQNEAPPYAYVSVEGPVVAIAPCTKEALRGMAVRYLGERDGEQYANRMPGMETAKLVSVQPDTWLGVDFSRT